MVQHKGRVVLLKLQLVSLLLLNLTILKSTKIKILKKGVFNYFFFFTSFWLFFEDRHRESCLVCI